MKKIATTSVAAAIAGAFAFGSPALAYDFMDEDLHEELAALGFQDETIAMFGADDSEEIETILAEEDDEEAKRARILALLPAHDEEHAAN
jgi:hypothetical protein